MVTQEQTSRLSTGVPEIDEKLGGGIPAGSLVLVEGAAGAGKSVLVQHFTQGALNAGLSVAYYTTENTIKDLMSQMASLDLDITDYFLCDRLRVYPLNFAAGVDTGGTFKRLLDHFGSLPIDFRLIVVDSLSGLISESDERRVVDFFTAGRDIADRGRSIIMVLHSNAAEDALLGRASSLCGAHLVLSLEQEDGKPVRALEPVRLAGVEQPEGDLTRFHIVPGAGIKVVPLPGAGR